MRAETTILLVTLTALLAAAGRAAALGPEGARVTTGATALVTLESLRDHKGKLEATLTLEAQLDYRWGDLAAATHEKWRMKGAWRFAIDGSGPLREEITIDV